MERSSEFLDSDLHGLLTATLDAVVTACVTSHADVDQIRSAAARHILAAVVAGERDSRRLERSTLAHIQAQFITGSSTDIMGRLPYAHRTSS